MSGMLFIKPPAIPKNHTEALRDEMQKRREQKAKVSIPPTELQPAPPNQVPSSGVEGHDGAGAAINPEGVDGENITNTSEIQDGGATPEVQVGTPEVGLSKEDHNIHLTGSQGQPQDSPATASPVDTWNDSTKDFSVLELAFLKKTIWILDMDFLSYNWNRFSHEPQHQIH